MVAIGDKISKVLRIMAYASFFLPCCLVSSCISVDKHVEKKTNELIAQMEKIPDWEQLPVKQVSWDNAVKMALVNNLEIRRGQEAIKNAERSVDRIFLDMIPGVNLDAIITKDINNIFDVSSDDLEYHTNILFNFPSLTKVPITYYTAKAGVFRAKKTFEMKQREVTSRLYKAAVEYSIGSELYGIQKDSIAFDDDGRERSRVEKEWNQKKNTLMTEISTLLGNMDSKWVITPSSLPKLNWNKYRECSKKLDFLVMTILAMEIEASRLQMFGIKMQYFPELNVNFYSPSLFTSTAGTYTGVFANSGDVQVNMALSWRMDTQLRVWYQLKAAKAEHEFLKEEIRMRVVERKSKVKTLIDNRDEFDSWYDYQKARLLFLKNRTILSASDFKQTQTELKQITQDLYSKTAQNAEVEAALIMEYGFL